MSAPGGRTRPRPPTMRSLLMLETIAEMVRPPEFLFQEVKLQLKRQGRGEPWAFTLFGTSNLDAAHEVARGEVDVAMLNPGAALTLAYRGHGWFSEPAPLRAIAVMPSFDQMAFGVLASTGIDSFADLAQRRYPLRVSLRAQRDHAVQMFAQEVLRAYGFSLADIEAWGGQVSYDWGLPYEGRMERLKRGEVDAIFDEGVRGWVEPGIEAGMRFLPVDEPVLGQLEAHGYRRGVLDRQRFPSLPADVPTLDFSGWPIYTHAAADDELIYGFCRCLDARKADIPWEEPGPLPLADMVRDSPAAPLDVPFHPAAERYWREAGYL